MQFELVRIEKDNTTTPLGEESPDDLEAAAARCVELRHETNMRHAVIISERTRRPAAKAVTEAEKLPTKAKRDADDAE